MENQKAEKGKVALGLFFTAIFFAVFIIGHYILMIQPSMSKAGPIMEFTRYVFFEYRPQLPYIFLVSFGPLVTIGFILGQTRSKKKINPESFKVYLFPLTLSYILLLLPCYILPHSNYPHSYQLLYLFSPKAHIWNAYAMPLLFFGLIYFALQYAKSFQAKPKKGNEPLLEVSALDEQKPFTLFKYNVRIKGIYGNYDIPAVLHVHNPFQGFQVQGNAGAGKSASHVEPTYDQAIANGWAIYNYDFKGTESPLSRCIYNSLHYRRREIIAKGLVVPKFEYVNALEPLKSTGKLNPLHPKYLSLKLYSDNAGIVFYQNLDKKAVTNPDFWVKNAQNYIANCIWALRNHEVRTGKKVCTIPHLVTLLLAPINLSVQFLLEDPEVAPTVQSIQSAVENEAASQLSGVEATYQVPVTTLYNPALFWTFGPEHDHEEIDLNINNPEQPVALSICNNENVQDAMKVPIGLVSSMLPTILNGSKHFFRTLFAHDELPTLYVKGLDKVPAEMRSKLIATYCAWQERSQLDRDYGKEQAATIAGNLSNQFMGGSSDEGNAAAIAKMFGHWDKPTESQSTSDSGVSTTDNSSRTPVLESKDIMGQNIGHFAGKIAGGKPSLFYVQMEDGRIHKRLGIPEEELLDIPYNWVAADNIMDRDNIKKHIDLQGEIYQNQLQEFNKDPQNFKARFPKFEVLDGKQLKDYLEKKAHEAASDERLQFQTKVMEIKQKRNFERINNDIAELLKPFKEREEQLNQL